MTRTVSGVAAGVALGVALMFVGELVARYLFPLPPDVGLTLVPDPKALLSRASGGLLGALLVTHVVAAAAAGTAAGAVAREGAVPIYAAVGLYLLTALAHVLIVPHPIWFVMVAVLLVMAVGWGLGRVAQGHAPA